MFKLLIASFLLSSSAAMAAAPLDRIIAVVNDEVVLESELAEMEQTVRQQLRQRNQQIPAANVLRRQVLERLIVQRIQVQRAQEMGVRVDDETLNAAMRQIAENNGLSLREFRDVIEEDGFSFATFRESIREEMLISRLRKNEVEDSVTISDREIDNFLATQTMQGNRETAYRLQHILIAMPDPATPEQVQEARARVTTIKKLLADGGDFSEVAAGYSDGQNALEGGDLGWRTQAELPSIFAPVVPQLRVGQVSDEIRNASGFHLIKLAERRSEESHIVKQTRASHILIQTNELVSDDQARSRLEQLRERVMNGENFADLARAHSDDTGSAIEGGSLGWSTPGAMVPEFEEVMDSLVDGQVSEVFQSRFGWHMILLEGRREQNMAEEYNRFQAREQLRQRKIEEEMDAWLRALRDEAYVEYREF